jgi:anti-sigma regulatory factor (Ser/Thr protein kinase)
MTPEEQAARRSFAVRPESVREARLFVRDVASEAGADPNAAALLASELATNAVVHAKTRFEVRVAKNAETFRVEIVNDAPEMLLMMKEPSEHGGRGLGIIAAVAQRWGEEAHEHEKVVWFELPTT